MLELHPLRDNEIAEFARPLPSGCRLKAEGDLSLAIGVGATVNGARVGLAVSRPRRGYKGVAEIHCLWLHPQHKASDLAVRILGELQTQLEAHRYARCDVFYDPAGNAAPSLRPALTASKWEDSVPDAYIIESSHDQMSKGPWMKLTFPAGYEVFPWQDVTEGDRAVIRDGQSRGWFAAALDPFLIDTGGVPSAPGSFGLRHHGALVGWVLMVLAGQGILGCRSLFVDPPLQPCGRSIALFAETIRHTQGYRYFWDVSFDRKEMRRFVDRKMRPYLSSIRTIYRASKVFEQQPARWASGGCI